MSSNVQDRAGDWEQLTPVSVSSGIARADPVDRGRDPGAGDVSRTPLDPGSPLLLVLAIVGGGYALLFLAAIVQQMPVKLIDQAYLGLDFTDFWAAAGDVLAGRDPYLRPRFVTPPLS